MVDLASPFQVFRIDHWISFKVSLPRYKEVNDGKKNTVFYIIEIQKLGSEKWTLEKRYKEFDNLHQALKKTYGNLPGLPGKTLLPLKESHEIEKRRQELEKYLNVSTITLILISYRLLLPELTLSAQIPWNNSYK